MLLTNKMPTRLTDTMNWEEICEHTLSKIGHKLKHSEIAIFRKWFMEREAVGYLFDQTMIMRCFRIWQDLQKGLDHFIVISGREGFGKTTLSFQIAAWVNPTGFHIGNVCYGAKSYLDILHKKSIEYTVDIGEGKRIILNESIVLDEGTELLSRESLNIMNRSLTKTFFVQRALNFLVITNIPNFHMLDSVIRLHRCRTLIEVIERGRYKCITGRGIRIIAKEGAQFKEVAGVKLPEGLWWHGQFSKEFPSVIDREEYNKHKLVSIRDMLIDMKDDVMEKRMVSAGKVAKEISSTPDTIIKLIKKGEIEGKQIGNKWYITRKSYDKLMTA